MRRFTWFAVLLVGLMLTVGSPLHAAAPVSLSATLTPGSSSSSTSGPLGVISLLLGAAAVGITIKKDAGSLSQKYQQRAVAAQKDYGDGVANAGSDWETATKNAEASYEQGVQQSIADKRFGKGVSGSAQKYQDNATKLGVQRYAGGVQNAAGAWARGMDPVLNTLKSLTLPPKGPRRSPQNQARANAVAVALGALKTGR